VRVLIDRCLAVLHARVAPSVGALEQQRQIQVPEFLEERPRSRLLAIAASTRCLRLWRLAVRRGAFR
jgi:hypothetical protein